MSWRLFGHNRKKQQLDANKVEEEGKKGIEQALRLQREQARISEEVAKRWDQVENARDLFAREFAAALTRKRHR